MIAVDTNILAYAHQRWMPEHALARSLMQSLAAGREPWAIPWPCVYEFYKVVTNRAWKERASQPAQAWAQLQDWFGSPSVKLLAETDATIGVLGPLLREVRGAKVHDARIAALCLAHGVDALYTRDRDFGLFPQLTVVDPFSVRPPSRAGERRARYAIKATRRVA